MNMRLGIGTLLLSLSLFAGLALAAEGRETVAGLPAAEALRLGEIMYHKGLLPSGVPIPALVQGEIELDGTMASCTHCHLPSGLGSLEGGIVSPPTNGAKLYAPLHGPRDIPGSTMKRSMFYSPERPAYTDESLSKMLLTGIDPTGRTLSETMPRYLLDEKEMEILTYYLKNLSSQYSPGVNQDEIRFATVVTADVSPADRDALLKPLQAYIRDDWNGRLKMFTNQWNAVWNNSATPAAGSVYRKIELDVWELKGSQDTWGRQLDEYYRQKPVFALLGGITGGSWAPVHDFCEKNQIPGILPITDLPVISENDKYTLYFSKGLYQEGEAAAKYLSRVFTLPVDKQIVQVFRDNERGRALAKGFSDTWEKLGNVKLVDRIVPAGEKTGKDFWTKLSSAHPGTTLLLWLDAADLAGAGALADSTNRPLVVSGSMLSGTLASLPESVREFTFITFPTRLPEEISYSSSMVNNWLAYKKLPVTNVKTASYVYLLKSLLTEALLNMAGEYYRQFLLDNLDESKDQVNSSMVYPALSFGPGQRYASKGCYIVTLTKGENPKVVRQSDWVIY
jgi:Periplasmic binding protein